MTNHELHELMDKLGEMMHEKDEIEKAYVQKNKAFFEEIEQRKDEIRKEILYRKVGEESRNLKVSYCKGAIRWDTKALEDYGLEHPEIMQYRKRGQAYCGFSTKSEGMSDD